MVWSLHLQNEERQLYVQRRESHVLWTKAADVWGSQRGLQRQEAGEWEVVGSIVVLVRTVKIAELVWLNQ